MNLYNESLTLLQIVIEGSFTTAAKKLQLSKAMVSRRISHLENELGVTLIRRNTRELQLTHEGEIFVERFKRISVDFNHAIEGLQSNNKIVEGMLTITAPPFFGRHYLLDILAKFQHQYPNIKLKLLFDNTYLNPISAGLDIIIRGSGFIHDPTLTDSDLKMKVLCKEKIGLYASPKYVAYHPDLNKPDDLINHTIISSVEDSKQREVWRYKTNSVYNVANLNITLQCNDIEAKLKACCADLGIARLTTLNAKAALAENLIVPVLQDYDWGNYHLYTLYPNHKQQPLRVKVFLKFLYEHSHEWLP